MNDSNFVYFPDTDGKRIAVNPQQVKMILEYEGYVHIYFSKDDGINIKTSMAEAVRILDGAAAAASSPAHMPPKSVEPRRRLMGLL